VGRYLTGLLLLSLLGSVAAEGVYRWVDRDGVTHFGDRPEASWAERVEIDPLARSGSVVASSEALEAEQQPMIIMYSAEWCGVCKQAKAYFSKHNVNYSDYDVEKSPRGISFYSRLAHKSVPQFMINGRRVAGFTKSNFDNLLGMKGD
jgi:glutaredoxin